MAAKAKLFCLCLASGYALPYRTHSFLCHVPIITPKQREGFTPLDPAQRRRLGQRSASERVNSRLKEEFGGRTIRVRGAAKVMCHLMFGVLAITALGLWQRLC